MDEKLNRLYKECVNELNSIGINIFAIDVIGKIDIKISNRNNKRYGCCRQDKPDEKSKTVKRVGCRKIIKYNKFGEHHIEISPWVMELEDDIIKNTIMHELIHCIPYCNDHGSEFKKYANYINSKLGYKITRVGNKKDDYEKSNLSFEEESYKYKVECKKCGQVFYRNRLNRNFTRRYRCGNCRNKFSIKQLR